MKLILRAFAAVLLVGFACSIPEGRAQGMNHDGSSVEQKQRMIVLTDIGAEVDDTESTVRLVLYSDVIDIEGLVATTSTWKRTSVSPELIHQVIEAYGKVHANLIQHDPSYPSAEALHALVKHGIAEYGMKGVGAGKDTEGSDWIIRSLETRRHVRCGSRSGEAPILWHRRCTSSVPPKRLLKLSTWLRSSGSIPSPTRTTAVRGFGRTSRTCSTSLLRAETIFLQRGPASTASSPESTTRRSATNGSPNTFSRGMGRLELCIRTLHTGWRATRLPGSDSYPMA